MATTAPTLESARLVLRAHGIEDLPAYAAMRADPEVMRHMGDGKPATEEEAWASFLKFPGMWQFMGFGSWAIVEKQTKLFVGDVGFSDRKRDRGPDLRDIPELGWSLVRTAFGNGFATEALRAALAWGCEALGHVRVIALTSEENLASMRVAEKCGFTEFHRGLSAGRPRVFFERILQAASGFAHEGLMDRVAEGHQEFRRKRWPEELAHYAELPKGQRPDFWRWPAAILAPDPAT
jgi:RimJ/RimL family protein N-acetyltransferase